MSRDSEIAVLGRSMGQRRKDLKLAFGKPCPECVSKLPKACPTILLPQQVCKIHKWKDPRPALTGEDKNGASNVKVYAK